LVFEQEDLMGGRPIIGITSELDAARWGNWVREAVVSPVTYTRAVERAGGAPVLLAPVPPSSVAALIAGVGGLVFTGGRDIDPGLYGQERLDETDVPERRRDRFEIELMRAALDAGVPVLAIGRGLHVLTLARGGRLIQDLPGHRPDPVKYQPHDVRLTGESTLGRMLGTSLTVAAAHHQAPAPGRLGDGVSLAGWSPADEATEAIEVDGHRFAIGVHWHPEEGDDPRLLEGLVVAAAEPRRSSSPDTRPGNGHPGARKQGKARAGSSRR
jgi:gamma-glutamyl-gamma-aminobutyrate hydrolase PuuD